MERSPQVVRDLTITQPLPIDYFSYSLVAGVHGTVTTACSPFFDVERQAAFKRNEQLPPHETVLRQTYISALILADHQGNLFELPVRMPFSKSRRQYKAVIHLMGEYLLKEGLCHFDHDLEVTVFYNLNDYMGGYISVTGIFSDEDGSCGIMNSLAPFRVEKAVISADFTLRL